MEQAFRECDYPTWAIRSGKAPSTRREGQQREEYTGYVSIPYIKGVSEPIGRILGSIGVRAAMKPTNTIKQALVRPKDRDANEDQAGVVYELSCTECPAQYIGQTGRHLSERIKEHKRATTRGYHLESGVAEHVMDTNHEIDWKAKIFDKDNNQRRRLVREAVWIRKKKPTMNREQGFELSKAYTKIITKDGNDTRPSRRGNHSAPHSTQ